MHLLLRNWTEISNSQEINTTSNLCIHIKVFSKECQQNCHGVMRLRFGNVTNLLGYMGGRLW
jgi:hypothetical protein